MFFYSQKPSVFFLSCSILLYTLLIEHFNSFKEMDVFIFLDEAVVGSHSIHPHLNIYSGVQPGMLPAYQVYIYH